MPPLGDSAIIVRTRITLSIFFLLNVVSGFLSLSILQAFTGFTIIAIFSLISVLSLMPEPSDFSEKPRIALVLLIVPLSIIPLSFLGLTVGIAPMISYNYIPVIVYLLAIFVLPLSEKNIFLYGQEYGKILVSLPKPMALGTKKTLFVCSSIFLLAIISITQAGIFQPNETSLSILEMDSMTFPKNEYDSNGVELVFSISSNKEVTYDLNYLVTHNGELTLSETIIITSNSVDSVLYQVPIDFSSPGEWRLEGTITSSDLERQVFHNFNVKG